MLAEKIVQHYAPVRQNLPDTKSSFRAAFAGHDFGAKRDGHFGTRPNAGANDFAVKVFEKSHIYSELSSFFLCFVRRCDGRAFSSGLSSPNFLLGGAVGLRMESKIGCSGLVLFLLLIHLLTYNKLANLSRIGKLFVDKR